MKRLAAAVAVLIAMILMFVFWQTRQKDAASSSEALSASKQVWELKFGHNMPVDSAMHEAAVLYAKTVEQKSGGRVKITLYPNQELGDDHQMLQMARQGKIDLLLTPTAKISVDLPSMQYVDLPFFFPTPEDLYTMLDGEPGQMLLDELKQIDLVGATFWENGFKHFTANTPLLHPEDFRGKTFRIMKSRLIQSQFEALGAKTLPIDFHKTRDALANGIVDGQENPLIAIKSMGIDKVQSDLTLSSHGYMGYVFSISAKTFKTLPPDLQMLLIRTARELTPYEREQTHKREAALLESMQKEGMHIHTLSPAEHAAFARILTPIADRYEEVIGSHILSKTQELLLEKYGPSPMSGKQIVIGLSADLSMSSKLGALAIKRGAQLAIDDINARGGVLGKPLVLIAKDNRGLATKGEDNVDVLAKRKDVVAIFGGVRGSVIDASIDEAQKAPIPYLIPWAATVGLTDKFKQNNVVFRLSADDEKAVAFMIEYLLRSYQRPVIVYENSIWGRGALKIAQGALAKHHRSFAATESFNIGQTDFESVSDRIASSGADSVLMIANSMEGADIINTFAEHRLRLPVISHWGITSNHFFEAASNALQTIDLRFFQTFLFSTHPTETSRMLAQRYQKRYALSSTEMIEAPSAVAQSYDLVHLLAQAITQAGTTDRKAVRTALEQLKPTQGVIRYYNPPFTPSDHEALRTEDYHMARYRPDGTIVPVE